MPPARPFAMIFGVVLGLCFSSCSSSSVQDAATLSVSSPALGRGIRIPSSYRCNEKYVWLPLEWSGVPKNAAEVVVAITVSHITDSHQEERSSLATEWIIGGLYPGAGTLRIGNLPSGAFISGHNVGKPNCPSRSKKSGMVFTVYAMPAGHKLQSFEAIGLGTIETLADAALASGSLAAIYGGRS